MDRRELRLIGLGLGLLLVGVLLPFLMVIRLLPPSFILSFLAHAASFIGLVSGLLGISHYAHSRRHDRD